MRTLAPALLLLVACGGGQPKTAAPAPAPAVTPPVPADPSPPVATADAGAPEATPAPVAASPHDFLFQVVTATSLLDGAHQEMIRTIALFERLGLTANGVLDNGKMLGFSQAYGDWARAHGDWIAGVSGPGAAEAFLTAHDKDPLPPWAP